MKSIKFKHNSCKHFKKFKKNQQSYKCSFIPKTSKGFSKSSPWKIFLGKLVIREKGPDPSVLLVSMYTRTAARGSLAENVCVNACPFVNLICNNKFFTSCNNIICYYT